MFPNPSRQAPRKVVRGNATDARALAIGGAQDCLFSAMALSMDSLKPSFVVLRPLDQRHDGVDKGMADCSDN